MAADSPKTDVLKECRSEVTSLLARCTSHLNDCQSGESTYFILHKCQQQLKVTEGQLLDDDPSGTGVWTPTQDWLRKFAKILLDVTYYEENMIVDNDFKGDDDVKKKEEIIESLSVPLTLAKVLSQDGIVSFLGEEITECIHWRKGALCYMFCATLEQDRDLREQHKESFRSSAKCGVTYLQDMLATRKPLAEAREDVSTNSEEMFDLLKKGVYSDTHILALMYTGELCYWIIQSAPSADCENFQQFKDIGKKNLGLYIDLVNGPLTGWDASRASEILLKIN